MSSDHNQAEQRRLEEVIDGVIQLGRRERQVSIGDIQQQIGQRSFGPFLFVPAIIEISPLGGIPGVPTLLALIVALFAIQMLMGREHFWMPDFLARRSVSGSKLESGLNKVRPVMRGLDRLIRPRLQWATSRSFVRALAVLCLMLATSVPPLELLPFASTVPFAAICLFGLGLTAKDGLTIMLGLITLVTGGLLVLGL
jgi:hypothetical protein